jgi:hypothetical protein
LESQLSLRVQGNVSNHCHILIPYLSAAPAWLLGRKGVMTATSGWSDSTPSISSRIQILFLSPIQQSHQTQRSSSLPQPPKTWLRPCRTTSPRQPQLTQAPPTLAPPTQAPPPPRSEQAGSRTPLLIVQPRRHRPAVRRSPL